MSKSKWTYFFANLTDLLAPIMAYICLRSALSDFFQGRPITVKASLEMDIWGHYTFFLVLSFAMCYFALSLQLLKGKTFGQWLFCEGLRAKTSPGTALGFAQVMKLSFVWAVCFPFGPLGPLSSLWVPSKYSGPFSWANEQKDVARPLPTRVEQVPPPLPRISESEKRTASINSPDKEAA